MRTAAFAALVWLVAAPAGAQDAGTLDRFTVDHAIGMTRVGGVELSPDGDRLLYTVTELDWDDNERDTRIWIARFDGSDARPFTSEEGDGSARWSPDGRWVAFLRRTDEDADEGGEGRQIWLIRTDGGEARQLTKHPASVRGYEWSPDSRGLVFLANDTLPDAEEKARKAGYDAVFVNEGPNGQQRGSYSNLWWVDADFEGPAPRAVTTGERRIGDFAIDPTGRRVAFTFRTENLRNAGYRSEIALADVAGGEIRVLTDNAAPESSLLWHPDGRLLFRAPDLEEWALDQGNLYLMAVESGAIEQLMPGSDLEIRDSRFTRDGRYLDLTALDRTVSSFYRLDLRSGELRQMSRWPGNVGSASWDRSHDRVAFTFDAPTAPEEVYTAPYRPGMARTAITDTNQSIRDLDLAEPRVVRWTSTDGLEIEGLLWRPAHLADDSPGALILEIHGGPAGVFTRGFDSDAQVLAAHGYSILQPNVRGSSGYGDALLRGNMNDIGGGDFDDLMTGVDAMIERGIAHPDSLAVKGWSYGGILGGWTLTRTDRFQAASLGAMVSDWPSEFGVGFNYDVVRWYLGGNPWSNRALWVERSAYTHADQVSTPTILFHGEEDTTDTPGQSMNFFVALQLFDVPSRLILFPREPHGIGEPRHHRTRLVEELRWFEKHVRGNDDWQAPERPDATKPDTDQGAGA